MDDRFPSACLSLLIRGQGRLDSWKTTIVIVDWDCLLGRKE